MFYNPNISNIMQLKKPKHYITTSWEYREGFIYPQPVKYCNDVKLTYYTLIKFKDIFGVSFSEVHKESICYNNALIDSSYNSELWKNDDARNIAFNKILEFNASGKSGSGSSVTPLFPFEIFMLNDGFEMVSFCEMNAINPAFSIVSEKQNDDILINPKYVKYSRCYQKDDYFICLAFGIEINKRKTNFYFKTNKSNYTFQVDNDINNYQIAINGKLKPLENIQVYKEVTLV